MIDPDIRDIIAPELAEGEELLWADRTEKSLEVHLGQLKAEMRMSKTYTAIFVLVVTGLTWFHAESTEHFVFGLTGFVLLYLVLFTVSRLQYNFVDTFKYGGYALTDRRLFLLDRTLKVADHLDTNDLTEVYEGAGGIVLRAVGTGLFRRYKLCFVDRDVYTTINHIDAALKQVRRE